MSSNTALSEALRRAGYDTGSARLHARAVERLGAAGRNPFLALDSFILDVTVEAEMLVALIGKDEIREAALSYLCERADEMSSAPAKPAAGGGGHGSNDAQGRLAPPHPTPSAATPTRAERATSETTPMVDSPCPSAPHSETPAAQQQVQPAGHHPGDAHHDGAGGHPIPETPPRAAGGGHCGDDTQGRFASPSTNPADDSRGRGQSLRDARRSGAASTSPAPAGGASQIRADTHITLARPNINPGHSKRGLAAIASVSGTVARSLLDTFIVNGRPVGDATVEEADAWAAARERDGRFVKLLIQGLPHGARIREFVTPEDARRRWELAQSAPAVAAPVIEARHPADYQEITNA